MIDDDFITIELSVTIREISL